MTEHSDVIEQRGNKWVLLSKKTGKVLGTHPTKEAAEEQERAVQASKHADGKRVKRIDRGTLAPAKRLDNGWLRVEGRSARTGILEYANLDGTVRRELVLPDDLFDAGSLDSARMVPVVNNHPTQGLLDAATAKSHQVGSVGENLRADGEYLVAPLMITDGEAVKAVEAGRSELSWGYDCSIDAADPSLFPKWGQHDGIQRDRTYNHLAVVDKARAGEGARIRLDANGDVQHEFATDKSAVLPIVASQQSNPEPPTMPTMIRIDALSISSDAADLQSVIDRVLAQVRADGEKATKTEKERADAVAASLAHVKKNAISRGNIVRTLVAKSDAMKAKMIGCDECAGTGKVMDDAAQPAKCDYCDGKGSLRMHDAIKAMPGEMPAEAEGEEEDAAPPEMVDDGSMERDDPEEEKVEKTANPLHKDAAKRATDERKALQKRRADSIARMIERHAKVRTALVLEASAHLDADVKLDGKSPDAIKRLVLAKVAPHIKLDGRTVDQVNQSYTDEMARLAKEKQDGVVSPSDAARAGVSTGAGVAKPVTKQAEWQAKVDARNKAMYHGHEAK